MEINTVLEALQSTNSSPSVEPPSQELDRNTFLRLFITQLQNQDPLNPAASEDFVAELAQFTALEQAEKTAVLIEELLTQSQQSAQIELVSLIGHEVITDGNYVHLKANGTTSLAYDLGDHTTSVTITVLDGLGNQVRTINSGPQAQGRQVAVWDGLDDNGNPMAEGTYQFMVQASNGSGVAVPVITYSRELVTSTMWENGQAELMLGSGRSVPSADVLSVL